MVYYLRIMKKRYILILLSIVLAIAYIDLIDSCRCIDRVISKVVNVENLSSDGFIFKIQK